MSLMLLILCLNRSILKSGFARQPVGVLCTSFQAARRTRAYEDSKPYQHHARAYPLDYYKNSLITQLLQALQHQSGLGKHGRAAGRAWTARPS
jgi:hypothetical protein